MPRGVGDSTREKLVSHGAGLVHQPAWVVSQVEDDAAESAPRPSTQRCHVAQELLVCAVLKTLHADVEHVPFEELGRNARDLDDLAHELEPGHLLVWFPPDRDPDFAPRLAAHFADQSLRRSALHGLAVDSHDAIARFYPGPLRG